MSRTGPAWQGAVDAVRAWRPLLSVEALAVAASLFFALTANTAFWRAVAAGGAMPWRLAVAAFVMVFAGHALLLGALLARPWAKPLLALLVVVTAAASFYTQAYGVYLDADMLLGTLHTEWAESRELLTPGLAWHLLVFAGLPCLLLGRIRLVRRAPARALLVRAGFLAAMAALLAAGAAFGFKDLSALVRNHREVRYLVTPANYVYGLGQLAFAGAATGDTPLQVVAPDARRVAPAVARRPRLLVMVVGETVRADHWGLNGYARQTTPRLARRSLVNFGDVQACGSSTEVSLPCMFSPYGRRDYDAARIRGSQSVLHVLDRVGVDVRWRDNQTGCKGVCRGLRYETVSPDADPALCDGLHCLDGMLLRDLPLQPDAGGGDRVVVLHMLGNHGPSYFQRYPPAFRRFLPACETAELGDCSGEQIVNAYDNALLYTDHVLDGLIDRLETVDGFDTALLYVADHGESLGESGLYLHGVPWPVAPREQLQVPMVLWFGPGFADGAGIDTACVQRRATRPASHDDLFSTLLGLFDVQAAARDPAHDLLAPCRRGIPG
ncbi:phosphoethanolamine transferase [Arenimonas composti]|nr:phosphoethanolamine--lipid A transferase [Arenimonas composti]